MAGARYRVNELQLEPGDAIYLYTDGIVEQHNADGELYGDDRLLKTVVGCDKRRDGLLSTVIADVRRHAAGVEQADDCTQLVLRYRGEPETFSREYKPTMEDLAKASADLAKALEGVPDDCANIMMVASDEIFANIVRYSGATDWSLTVERTHHPDGVRLVITDNGKPFDPLSHRDPDTTLCADDREVGGLGILIVKKTMSPVTYRRNNGRNILTMGKEHGDQN